MVVLVILVSSLSSSSVLFVPSLRARIKDALGIESLQEQANCTTTTDKTILLDVILGDKKCPPAKQSGVRSGTSPITPPVGTSPITPPPPPPPPVGTSGVTPPPPTPPPVGTSGVTPTPINLTDKCFTFSQAYFRFTNSSDGVYTFTTLPAYSFKYRTISSNTIGIIISGFTGETIYTVTDTTIRSPEGIVFTTCPASGSSLSISGQTSGVTPNQINLTSRCFQLISNQNIKYRFTNTTNGIYIFGSVTTLNFTYRTITNNTIGITIISLQGVPQPETIFTVSESSITNSIEGTFTTCPASGQTSGTAPLPVGTSETFTFPQKAIIINEKSNTCLDADDRTGAVMYGWACDPSDSNTKQQWVYNSTTKLLQNNRHLKCMDLEGGFSNDGRKVQSWDCSLNNPNMQWEYIPSTKQFRNVKSNTCLDLAGGNSTNGTVVQGWNCSTDQKGNQQWNIRAVP